MIAAWALLGGIQGRDALRLLLSACCLRSVSDAAKHCHPQPLAVRNGAVSMQQHAC